MSLCKSEHNLLFVLQQDNIKNKKKNLIKTLDIFFLRKQGNISLKIHHS